MAKSLLPRRPGPGLRLVLLSVPFLVVALALPFAGEYPFAVRILTHAGLLLHAAGLFLAQAGSPRALVRGVRVALGLAVAAWVLAALQDAGAPESQPGTRFLYAVSPLGVYLLSAAALGAFLVSLATKLHLPLRPAAAWGAVALLVALALLVLWAGFVESGPVLRGAALAAEAALAVSLLLFQRAARKLGL